MKTKKIKQEIKHIKASLVQLRNKSRKCTIEHWLVHTILVDSFDRYGLNDMKSNHGLKLGDGRPLTIAQDDFQTLKNGNPIKLKEITRQKAAFYNLKVCKFILSDKNIVSVARGTKQLLTKSRDIINLPKITRKNFN